MRLFLILIFQCCFILFIQGQTRYNESPAEKNVISLDGETNILGGNYSINYERIFRNRNTDLCHGPKVGFGQSQHWEEFGNYIFKLSYLISKRNFEIGLGCALTFMETKPHIGSSDTHIEYEFWPIFSLGSRRPGRNFIFRFYMCTWGLGLSVGYLL